MGYEITPLHVFEEFRFVLELLGAQLLLLLPFAQRRKIWLPQGVIGGLALLGMSQLYHVWPKGTLVNDLPGLDMCIYNVIWYSFLILLTIAYLKTMFRISWCDLIFLSIMAYAAQHMVYASCNELLAMELLPQLREHLLLYILVCAVWCLLVYAVIWELFSRPLQELGGTLFGNNKRMLFLYLVMLVVLVSACFAQQHLFQFAPAYFRLTSVMLDILVCVLILMVLYAACHNGLLFRSEAMLRQMLSERENQYKLSKESIALINQKCHDLKHQIQALRHLSAGEQATFLEDVESSITSYDALYQTGNEALDTLLTEKQLYCDRHEIQLTCIADGTVVEFLSPVDLYTLLGNALENAVQCVSDYEPAKRLITLHICRQGNFALVSLTNYFEGTLLLKHGLPETTKGDPRYHGFGVWGMRSIAEKYHGVLELGQEENRFILTALFPL